MTLVSLTSRLARTRATVCGGMRVSPLWYNRSSCCENANENAKELTRRTLVTESALSLASFLCFSSRSYVLVGKMEEQSKVKTAHNLNEHTFKGHSESFGPNAPVSVICVKKDGNPVPRKEFLQYHSRVTRVGIQLLQTLKEQVAIAMAREQPLPGDDVLIQNFSCMTKWLRVFVGETNIKGGYAMSNQTIMLSTALLDAVNDDQLAWVMAHELSHLLCRDIYEVFTEDYRFELGSLWAAAWYNYAFSPFVVPTLIGGFAAARHLAYVSRSRKMEYRADRIGIIWGTLAGYDPNKMAQAIYNLDNPDETFYEFAIPGFCKTHPNADQRHQQLIAEVKPEETIQMHLKDCTAANPEQFLAELEGRSDEKKTDAIMGIKF